MPLNEKRFYEPAPGFRVGVEEKAVHFEKEELPEYLRGIKRGKQITYSLYHNQRLIGSLSGAVIGKIFMLTSFSPAKMKTRTFETRVLDLMRATVEKDLLWRLKKNIITGKLDKKFAGFLEKRGYEIKEHGDVIEFEKKLSAETIKPDFFERKRKFKRNSGGMPTSRNNTGRRRK